MHIGASHNGRHPQIPGQLHASVYPLLSFSNKDNYQSRVGCVMHILIIIDSACDCYFVQYHYKEPQPRHMKIQVISDPPSQTRLACQQVTILEEGYWVLSWAPPLHNRALQFDMCQGTRPLCSRRSGSKALPCPLRQVAPCFWLPCCLPAHSIGRCGFLASPSLGRGPMFLF